MAVGSGDFHAPQIMNRLDLPHGALRAGFLHYNTTHKVDRLLQLLDEI